MLKVIGVGDNVVDRYIHTGTMYPGGNSLNFAVYAKQLGCTAAYTGVLAQDAEGRHIMSALDQVGIDYSRSTILPHGITGRCSMNFIDGDRIITDDNDFGSVKSDPLVIDDALLAYISTFDIAHSSCFSFIEEQLGQIREAGVPVVYDFSDSWSEDSFRAVCPSVNIAFFSGGKRPTEELQALMQRIVGYGSELVIATMGKHGAMVYDGARFYAKEPYSRELPVLDTLGAGDAFLAGFLVVYLQGKKRLQAITAQKELLPKEDKDDYCSHLIDYAMCSGNAFAIKNCMHHGTFGMGAPLVE